ncbi:MAG: hypothetical protein R3B89_21165 [Polyangiaceae bacterium]
MRLHEQRSLHRTGSSRRAALAALVCFAVWLCVGSARADLVLEGRRPIERRVTIENLDDFAGWKIVAFPYNFSRGVPRLGLATFDVIGLTPPRHVDAHVYAIPPGISVQIPESTATDAGLAQLQQAHALDSGLVLGAEESVGESSEIQSVREVLRIKQLTPESFRLERVALEYRLRDDIEERVDCPPRGRCRGPEREPGVQLHLTRHVDAAAPAEPSVAPVDPLASAAPTPSPTPPEAPMSPLIWVAIAALVLGVGLFALRARDSDSDSAPR